MGDFPSSPYIGQTHTTSDGTVWTWDGFSWVTSGFGGVGGVVSGGISNVSVSTGTTTVLANGINFVNTSSILSTVSSGVNGNANVNIVVVNPVPTHPADGRQYGLDATAAGNPTLRWRLLADQSTFLTFSASLGATFANGPFSGSTIAEKGYVSTNINFTLSTTDTTNFSITDSFDANLNNVLITWRNATGAGNTGNATATGSYRDVSVSEPATFGVTIKSNTNELVYATRAFSWRYRVYWGVNASTSLTEAQIEALVSNGLYTSYARTYTFNASGGGVYLYVAWPTSFGAASQFTVGGLVTTFTQSTVSVTNAYGSTTNYYVYRSNDVQSGSGISVVVT